MRIRRLNGGEIAGEAFGALSRALTPRCDLPVAMPSASVATRAQRLDDAAHARIKRLVMIGPQAALSEGGFVILRKLRGGPEVVRVRQQLGHGCHGATSPRR